MFNPVIKIHGRHISSVLQSFTIQMVLTVDICFTYSTDDLSNVPKALHVKIYTATP